MAATVFSSATAPGSPAFLRMLLDPSVRTVLIAGCGGGFDFVHSATLIPLLAAHGKQLVIHSYSFMESTEIRGGAPLTVDGNPLFGHVVDDNGWAHVKVVDRTCLAPRSYGPEVGMCQYFDEGLPSHNAATTAVMRRLAGPPRAERSFGPPSDRSPEDVAAENAKDAADVDSRWCIYASYARKWTVLGLRRFYHVLCREHEVDAILLIDGGSDSLMAGDEAGLGDPIEDAVSLAAVATLEMDDLAVTEAGDRARPSSSRRPLPEHRIVACLGVGCDRFNCVSDAATLRAVAELTGMSRPRADTAAPASAAEVAASPPSPSSAASKPWLMASSAATAGKESVRGFLGVFALDPDYEGTLCYRTLIERLQAQYRFKSVIANAICATATGSGFGSDVVPRELQQRVAPGQLYLWPLMSWVLAFDVRLVYQRSLLGKLLLPCRTTEMMYETLQTLRHRLEKENKVRPVEMLPAPQMSSAFF